MPIALALASAVAYGVSDFLGGIFTRASTTWRVAFVGQASSTVSVAVVALFVSGTPVPADFAWAGASGIGSGLGAAFLYRGLGRSKMSIVAPVSAVGCALLPFLVGVGLGERPGLLPLLGIAAAFPAIVLISRTTDAEEPDTQPVSTRAGVVDGVLAGVGFGVMFVFLDRVGDDAGLTPMIALYACSVLAVVLTAVALREPFLPRAGTDLRPLAMGPIGAFAVLTFLYATHEGLLSVVSVIASLYPAATVLLAALLLAERVQRHQGVGLLLAALAVALVATG